MSFFVLLLSVLMGVSFVFGMILSKKYKTKKMLYFSTGLALMILSAVLFCDILPEIYEMTTNYYQVGLVLFTSILGFFVFKIIDLFVPHHHHEHVMHDEAKKDHKNHLYHIGLLTFIFVIVHNFLEGIAFYMVGIESIKSALLMSGAIALHNIPLGIEISYFFTKKNDNKLIKNLLLIFSGTFGALFGILLGDISVTTSILLLSLTSGMMLYIIFYELLGECIEHIKQKGMVEGLLVGAIIFVLMFY